ncbi:unnamed protein product [Didymodactylos carnosus]|uniref:Uncharacterized protein n=1 Tax=Didymodactylos carnosus TaxID=1234261 RepID=A0A814NIH9_9BILA|nr:unnamed protein product [Didymodactylos carnosus]CAF3857501.1 unnamed protein product [Didymodactylos carnosus]
MKLWPYQALAVTGPHVYINSNYICIEALEDKYPVKQSSDWSKFIHFYHSVNTKIFSSKKPSEEGKLNILTRNSVGLDICSQKEEEPEATTITATHSGRAGVEEENEADYILENSLFGMQINSYDRRTVDHLLDETNWINDRQKIGVFHAELKRRITADQEMKKKSDLVKSSPAKITACGSCEIDDDIEMAEDDEINELVEMRRCGGTHDLAQSSYWSDGDSNSDDK